MSGDERRAAHSRSTRTPKRQRDPDTARPLAAEETTTDAESLFNDRWRRFREGNSQSTPPDGPGDVLESPEK